MKNIIEYFLQKKNSEELFCIDPISKYTYNEAYKIVKNIACFFHENNISKQPIMLEAERNNKTLLTILGIILSNNSFVPVNPNLNYDKLDLIIQSSQIKYEVTFSDNSLNNLIHFNYDEIIKSENENDDILDDFISNFNEYNDIYTIYTSGSTGIPKGVVKTQINTISFVENYLSTFKFHDKLKIANQSPLFFDASMKDVFLAIANGGTIFFPDKSLFSMPFKLIEYLNEYKIDYICWVPSALTIIVRLNTFKYIKPLYLKYVFFVGEVFLPKYLNVWLDELPDIIYANIYGSTEIAGVCLYKIIDHKLKDDSPIPLGKPICNNNVYLHDGEIIVESKQIAKGYTNDPIKNQQVFVEKDGKRILKTGDYAFINDEGDIVFSTRKDFQIKHMGYRIELQEIDLAVGSLSYISDCAVLFDETNDKIVAFVSMNQNIESPVKTIIKDLKTKLPEYMLPNKVEILQELPLNANGKIDRANLKKILEKK